MLNSRELASLIWLAVALVALVVFSVRSAEMRKSLAQVGGAFVKPSVLMSFLGFYVYLTVIVAGAGRLGLWETGLLSETGLWFLVGGLGMFWSVNEAEKDPNFFAKALRRLFAGTVLVELFFELETFPLWIELIIQPLLTILILMEIVARRDPEQAQAAGCVSSMLATAGFVFLAATAFLIVRHWDEIDWTQQVRTLAMLIWLPAAAIPYLYVLAWLMAYGRLMRFVRWAQNDRPPTWGNRLAVVLGFNFHLYALGRARVDPARELAEAPGYRESRIIVRRFRMSIQAEATP